MATEKTEAGWTEATNGAVANTDSDWNTVENEAQIVLDNEGDGFIGTYVGMDTVGSGMVQAHFENVTYLDGRELAPRAFINSTRDLTGKLKTVPHRRQVRAVWVSSLNTGQISPMRVFTVDWR